VKQLDCIKTVNLTTRKLDYLKFWYRWCSIC